MSTISDCPIYAEVHQLVTLAGVSFSAVYVGERTRALNGDSTMDQWLCRFTKGEGKSAVVETFDYFTGLGLRKLPAGKTRPMSWEDVQSPRELAAWKAKNAQPQPPHVADILYCLISDSEAASQSFAHWCADFGYDTDSRKALDTYTECQTSSDKLHRIFSGQTVRSLRTALEGF